jgi:hypothetical protein
MNHDWHDLIQRYIAGTLTDDEALVLQSALKSDKDLRALYLDYMNLDVALGSHAESRAAVNEILASPMAGEAKRSTRWLSWRPLAAAAAGIVFGMFCTAVAFGFVMPRAVATASRLFALVDGSFEMQSGRVAAGFPSVFGVWSGDEAEIVRADAARDGGQALRFVRAEREPALPNYGAASCDVYQLVDLRSLKADAAGGEAMLELSVQFLDARAEPGEPVKFIARLYAFAGSPETLPTEWPLSQKEALASGSGAFDSTGGTPRSWHQVTTKVLLPPQADFAVLHLVAHKPKTPAGTDALFGAQFADDVRLTLKTQPALPVQLAQR